MDANARAAHPGPARRQSPPAADGAGGAFSALARPAVTARQVRAAVPAMLGMFSAPPTPPTSLDQVVGADRRLAVIRGNLELARQVAHQHGAKVNDVLLTVTAAGLRGLLCGRGESVDDLTLPVYVPVTLQQAQDREQAPLTPAAPRVSPPPEPYCRYGVW